MADWEIVRELAASFPGADESTTYGKPAFKVGGKLFVWMSPDRAAEGALAVRVDPDEKPALLETFPDRYFSTPHYEGHPILLVDLDRSGMLLHDNVMAERKAEARAFSSGLCREERIEHLFPHLRGDTGAVVADPDFHTVGDATFCCTTCRMRGHRDRLAKAEK